jgi:aspartyl protease family protein
MRSEFVGAVIVVCVAIVAVKYFEHRSHVASLAAGSGVIATAAPKAAARPTRQSAYGSEVRLSAGANHQYFVTAAVNDRPASFLVDTGASYVALRDSDARDARIYVALADYKHAVRTANGETKAALVEIREIEIDGIRVENVQAFVLPDDQLDINLLGMSFLSKLESVESRNGELVLKG